MSNQPEIIFRNSHFAAALKQAGVLTTPSRFPERDRREVLGIKLQTFLGQQIFPVHRLDFEVSGLVLFALNSAAHANASAWFENRLVQKTYLALTETHSVPPPPLGEQFTWESRLLRGKKRAYEHAKGKRSVTTATLLEQSKTRLLWQLSPLTGRPHQLRYELSTHGFPILGDSLYGSRNPWKSDAIALQSTALVFPAEAVENFGLPAAIRVPEDFCLRLEEANS